MAHLLLIVGKLGDNDRRIGHRCTRVSHSTGVDVPSRALGLLRLQEQFVGYSVPIVLYLIDFGPDLNVRQQDMWTVLPLDRGRVSYFNHRIE